MSHATSVLNAEWSGEAMVPGTVGWQHQCAALRETIGSLQQREELACDSQILKYVLARYGMGDHGRTH